jgi:replicative superfamily II helicase
MSATLPNLRQVAGWLEAKPFVKNFRPIPLVEYYKVNQNVYNKKGELVRTIDNTNTSRTDPDQLVELCAEV